MKISRLPLLALVLALPLAPGAFAAGGARQVNETAPLDADGTLTIKTYKGSIHVQTGAAGEVRVAARIEPDGDDAEQARKVDETRVVVSGRGGAVTVRSDYDAVKSKHVWFGFGDDGRLPFVRYEITIPATARLVIDDYKSDIEVRAPAPGLRIDTYKGHATLHGVVGPARIETYKGDVRLEAPHLAADLKLSTYKGEFEIVLSKDARFSVDADTGRRGSFESDFAVTSSTRGNRHGHEGVRGDANGGGPRIDFETTKGSLRLRAK